MWKMNSLRPQCPTYDFHAGIVQTRASVIYLKLLRSRARQQSRINWVGNWSGAVCPTKSRTKAQSRARPGPGDR